MYLIDDYVTNLFSTVLDFQIQGVVVERAIAFYRENRWGELRTLPDLKHLLTQYVDDKEGNTALAQYLWGYKHWRRTALLRNLVHFFESIGVTSQKTLNNWAKTSTYERDFKGKIKGMGYAIYQWLVMRQGVETIKPDVHIRRFVELIVQHNVTDNDLVDVLERVARELGLKAYELDWRIWEYQRRVLPVPVPKVPVKTGDRHN